MFQIPEAKLAKLKRSLESMILDGYATYRELARLAGFIISLSLAVGPIARLFTRQMYFFIQSRPSWDVSFTFSEALLQELKFWLQHIDSFNGYSIRGVFCAESTIYTDASDFAFGGYLATLGGEPVRGMFSPADVDSSSTYRELKAVFYVLKSYAVSLKHQRVKVFVDNMGASRILMVGSSKLHLQQIAVDIFSICLSFDISLDSQWLPREENAHISKVGVWKEARKLSDPELSIQVPHLLDLVLASNAPSTTSKYSYGWARWRRWTQSKQGVSFMPAHPLCIALYLLELTEDALQKNSGCSAIDSALYGIRWAHKIAGLASPTEHPTVPLPNHMVIAAAEGARRNLKSGGASNDGYKLSDPELKDRHAGWKNPCTKRRYTKRSHSEMLEVTRSMGI
ncbi:unnamed protein product [Porites lobata]|uniref:RNase H type-1 domain-containing protein n=1 Tax=Porites lobata TaxID=104759 RepID=A0ABN8RQE5_9CNID|nr:unnamed protein product [Porites lobata]